MKRAIVTIVAAQTLAAGGLGCSGKGAQVSNDPEQPTPIADPPTPMPMPTGNPPPPPMDPPTATLPTWAEVGSGHPAGATNPPSPVLVVTPDGDCYKDWKPGMISSDMWKFPKDGVYDCTEDCGTAIQCPPEAAELLAAYNEPPIANPPPPPPDPLPPG